MVGVHAGQAGVTRERGSNSPMRGSPPNSGSLFARITSFTARNGLIIERPSVELTPLSGELRLPAATTALSSASSRLKNFVRSAFDGARMKDRAVQGSVLAVVAVGVVAVVPVVLVVLVVVATARILMACE